MVSSVVVTKDKMEVKASSKDMEDRLRLATTQFKVMDVDIGKETDNRAEIITKGMAAIKDKVRSDMQEEWTKLAEGVDVAPLVRKTAKPTGKDHYSAPLLFTVQGLGRHRGQGRGMPCTEMPSRKVNKGPCIITVQSGRKGFFKTCAMKHNV